MEQDGLKHKRKVSVLIPYRERGGAVEVYLQWRSKDAPRAPDCFGFFGGGVEAGESVEEGLMREMKEELDFVPQGHRFFKRYEFEKHIMHVFTLKVGEDFESRVKVLEGEYGKFLKERETLDNEEVNELDRPILKDFFESVRGDQSKIA